MPGHFALPASRSGPLDLVQACPLLLSSPSALPPYTWIGRLLLYQRDIHGQRTLKTHPNKAKELQMSCCREAWSLDEADKSK